MRALRNQVRRDIGRFPSLSAEAVAALTTQYHEHPGWTAQLHHDNLRVTLRAAGLAVSVVPQRTTLPQGAGTGAPAATEAQHRWRHRRARSSRTTRGAQLRSRTRPAAAAPRLPSRLAQGADPQRRLRQTAAGRLHRRPLAVPLPMLSGTRTKAAGNWSTVCARRCRRWACRAR